jgi:hypothetical protein
METDSLKEVSDVGIHASYSAVNGRDLMKYLLKLSGLNKNIKTETFQEENSVAECSPNMSKALGLTQGKKI